MALLESEVTRGGDEERRESETSAPIQSRVLTNVFVPTRTQVFTVPPEGERANLTRRRVVIDETRRPTTALCELVDDFRETEESGRVPSATEARSAVEGPGPNGGEPKANFGRSEPKQRRRSSAIPSSTSSVTAAAAPPPTNLPFSPSTSSLDPPDRSPDPSSFKSTSPFSPMQTHSRSQLSLQFSNHHRPSEPETVDSPTLVVIDPTVAAILNERSTRSPSAPDTPTNSLSQVTSYSIINSTKVTG